LRLFRPPEGLRHQQPQHGAAPDQGDPDQDLDPGGGLQREGDEEDEDQRSRYGGKGHQAAHAEANLRPLQWVFRI
jgi:hypothetical protein